MYTRSNNTVEIIWDWQHGKTPNDPEWIVAYITHSLQEAHIIAGKLRSSDVHCRIHQEAGATALGITVGNLGEIKVLVSPADFERAEVILFPEADNKIQASNDKNSSSLARRWRRR